MRVFLMTAAIALTVGAVPVFAQSSSSDATGKSDTSTSSAGQYTGSGVAGTPNRGGTVGTAPTANNSGATSNSAASPSDSQNMTQPDDNNRPTKADKAMTRHRSKVSRHSASHDSNTNSGTENAAPSNSVDQHGNSQSKGRNPQ